MDENKLSQIGREILKRSKGRRNFRAIGYAVLRSHGIYDDSAPDILSAVGKILAQRKKQKSSSSPEREFFSGRSLALHSWYAKRHEEELTRGIPEDDQ